MKFTLTDEQSMIQQSAIKYLQDSVTSESVRSAMASGVGYNLEHWQHITNELGWSAVHVPQAYAGLNLSYVELVLLLEQMGRYLYCSPFLASSVMATNTLLLAATAQQKADYIPTLCSGQQTATLAFVSLDGSRNVIDWGTNSVQATYQTRQDGFQLNGTFHYVIDGHTADVIIVAARQIGTEGDDGVSLFMVPANMTGVERCLQPTMDQTRKQALIKLNNIVVPRQNLIGSEGKSAEHLVNSIALANIALAAEQVGGAQQVLDNTVNYTKERYQFNRPIASFQAIKHKAADMMLRCEVARSGVYYGACVASDFMLHKANAKELREAASIAKAYASNAYYDNASESLQMHGGVGFTWEFDVHLYFKRAKASQLFLGNSNHHYEQLADQLLGY
ncbi:acyl-CoA dehydrogenase family protein [Thalassotalea maritima]|uniref:acyl-CoA dehydrogenase family protein n=1 Tax=Thalassotalea maritima TaxID=3242416 RepID=UPI003526F691